MNGESVIQSVIIAGNIISEFAEHEYKDGCTTWFKVIELL
jgi:hypothetical protein